MLAVETVADEHHFQFQAAKYSHPPALRKLHEYKDIRDGFYQSGLFKYSRHPNYFAEQAMWVCVYCFVIPTTGTIYHFSIIGCILLVLLFQGSITFSESITKAKYPGYGVFQNEVSRCIPWWPAEIRSKTAY
jgi:steroid 5-alpha reductase family enzyme